MRFTFIIRNQKRTGTSNIKQSLCEKVCSVFCCWPNTAGSAKILNSPLQIPKLWKVKKATAKSRSWFEHYFTQRLSISTQQTIIYRCCAIYARKMCVFVLCTERAWIPITCTASYSVARGTVATVLHQNVWCHFCQWKKTKSNFQSIEHRQPLAGVNVGNPRDHEQSSVSSKSQYEAIHRGKCLEFHEMVPFCVS